LLERLLRLGEIIVGVQCVVTQKLPQRPVDLVRARPRNDIRCRS
jgi:hypothetical protein